MNSDNIEAIGKVGIGIVAIVVLGWVLNTVLEENREINAALVKQVTLLERQTQALEQLVKIYSGD